MMSLLKRFRYTLEADLHALLDRKEEKNPIKMLNQYIREAEKMTEQTGKLLERQQRLKEELEQKLKDTEMMLKKRTNQLELAKSSGEEDLIWFAMQEVEAYKNRHITLRESLEQANREYLQLEQKYELMKHKIEDMKVRQLQLMGKENVVRANVKMDQVFESNDLDFQNLSAYIDQLSKKVEKNYEYSLLETRLALLEQNQAAGNPSSKETVEP
ncbi:PspA/IM30 family protein [Ureibacillus sp. FSL K6-8385]|uniref:PspA/IM30 family protein n=2 Tax=Bacillati TaxID=1783272 RepID=A0A540V8H8_9BACL|nr:PspA/IM30 family protein [Ureibacillus terrenus]MED3660562.1 PspA/IM30 family protein [Ureibacillus terrenus]MED3762682.1 PspA/IM30 family protein [Ureibacillus terrenus]TQE92443.1 PspA/IM30 family protein [Ureibacillus terrenus]